MIKSLIVLTAFLAGSANAVDVTVALVDDHNLSQGGFRAALAAKGPGLNPGLSVTHIDNQYDRYAITGEVDAIEFGGLKVAINGGMLWQNTAVGNDGYGFTVGAKVAYPLTKQIDVIGSVESVGAQAKINSYDGVITTVGLTGKF